MKPCAAIVASTPMESFCDDCDHAVIAHRRDKVCSVCEAVEEIKAMKGEPS